MTTKNKERLTNAVSGGVAAFCAVTANNPLELIRIRHQLLEKRNRKDDDVMKKGYWGLAKKILAEEGWKGICIFYFLFFGVSIDFYATYYILMR